MHINTHLKITLLKFNVIVYEYKHGGKQILMQMHTSRGINVDSEKRNKKDKQKETRQRTRKRIQREKEHSERDKEREDAKKEKEGQEEKVPGAHGSEDTPQLTSNHERGLGEPTAPTRPNGPAGDRDQLVQKAQLTGASCPAVLERQRERQRGHRKDKEKTQEGQKRKTTGRTKRKTKVGEQEATAQESL